MKASRVLIVLAVLILAGVVGAWRYAEAWRPQLELGVGYAARVGCACRYIGRRDIAQCRADFEPGMEMIALADEPATRTVTASVPLLASRSVRFDPLLGCQPEPFRGRALEWRRAP